MEIRLKLKPVVYDKTNSGLYKTKKQLLNAMKHDAIGISYSKYYSGVKKSVNGEYVMAYSLNKFRHKSKEVLKPQARGKFKKVREVIREAHWVGYKYKIPVALLEAGNIKVVQHARHFDIIQL